ncbi:MAG: alpha/beta hydrolase [Oscillospiraceae bacterium]|nr:alpha/beta hydrolase [Oscillospiraceae bacterium]
MLFYKKIEEVPIARVIEPERVDWDKEGLKYWEHVPYSSQSPRQYMDIWAPEGAKDLPVIIWIHGGGWNDEKLTEKYRPEPEMARLSKLGFVCASIEYRLAKHAPFPAQIEDCKCAVRFLRANAEKFGIDPNKIGAWGESAGGHLTALLAVTGNVKEFEGKGGWLDQSSAIQAAVPWYAPYDMVASVQQAGGNELFQLLFGGTIEEKKDLIWAASPMKYAGDPLPPMLLMHGDMDRLVPTKQTLDFYLAARERGNPVELCIVPGQGHGFFDGDIFYERIGLFFCRVLKGEY